MLLKFRLPTKIKFALEKKRKRSVSPSSSSLRNPKRRATLLEFPDSPLARLFNDVGIKALAREVSEFTIDIGKRFLSAIRDVRKRNDPPKECAEGIYEKACQAWLFYQGLLTACAYAMEEEPSFSDTLLAHANNDTPEQRMASMMKDPWLGYVLGCRQSSYAFITRGLLSILIAYWNMKDILDKYGLSRPRHARHSCFLKYEFLSYAADHIQDFQNLKEVLDSKYGSYPFVADSLFREISDFQVNDMKAKWKSGRRSMIQVMLIRTRDGPPRFSGCLSSIFGTYHTGMN